MDDDYETVPTTIPGPGSYYNSKRDTSFNKGAKSHKYQLFNSSVPRFPDEKWNSYIGPGTYDSRNGKTVSKKMQPPKVVVPFNSESLRDYEVEKSKDEIIPGPGAYEHPYDMAKIMTKKVEMARKRRRRTKSELPLKENKNLSMIEYDNDRGERENEKQEEDNNLGPGVYHLAHQNMKIRKGNTNATFVSNTNRFKHSDLDAPPVGQYELNYYNIDKGPRKSNNVFLFFLLN